MKREIINNLKTQLKIRTDYIVKAYESIKEEDHYDAFINMCDTHIQFCNFWAARLKRQIFGLRLFKNYRLYNDYMKYAQHTISIIQEKINEYASAFTKCLEDQKFIDDTKKKIETEFLISSEIQDVKYKEIRKNEHKTIKGFGTKTKKRKKTNDKENTPDY